jgi:neutral ceramidase
VLSSPLLAVSAGTDAPGRLESDTATVTPAAGACAGNNAFRFGSGLYDVTGVAGNTSSMGYEYPLAILSGIHQRQYARAFAFQSPCNGKRLMFVSVDVGMIWGGVRLAVLAALAVDPDLSPFYTPDNLMLSATHTHSGPAGFSHDAGGNFFHFGFDQTTFDAIANGIVGAIRLAHADLQAHPQTAPVRLAVGELLDTNTNRSPPAFELNPDRTAFLNSRSEPVNVDKRVVQLNLARGDGTAVGIVNWFGVHTTSIGTTNHLVSSDNKGFASLGFERLMRTDYAAAPGADTFVAAFAQTDEGDSSPNLCIFEHPFPDGTRGCGHDEYESNAISGTKQLARALTLFTQGANLAGAVDYRLFHVAFEDVTVTDPVVLASLHHPAELDADPKKTCSGVLGPSFGGGAEDGPGPGSEGVSCKSSPDVLAAAAADFDLLLHEPVPPTSPYDFEIPGNLVSTGVFCNLHEATPLGDFSCQAEKPAFLPSGAPILPFQLFRVGNLAILGLPWEITTTSARRLRKLMLDTLAPAGIDTVIIAGLSNDYVNYMATREEYSLQHYEGASTLFGPWTLAAAAQESRRLALAMRDGLPAPDGPTPSDSTSNPRPPYTPSDVPGLATGFGDVVADVPASAAPGDTVTAEFQAGHPRNDLRTQSSYVFAERQNADGSWSVVATDRGAELRFVWKPLLPQELPIDTITGSSTAQAVWTLPRDTPAGNYRLRHVGAAQTSPLVPAQPYEGISSTFTVAGPAAACP